MNTKKLTLNAILLALGFILYQFTPNLGTIQIDVALSMLFIIILLNKDYKTALIAGIITGIFTAMTSKTAGAQIPNIIDKVVTANVVYLLILPLRNRINKNIILGIVLPIGTIVSGATFLSTAIYIFALKIPFIIAFTTVVIPTAICNFFLGLILFNIFDVAFKRSGLSRNFDL
ncbi:MAG: tryptophan transporter [Clostridiaceae bacterium]